MPIADSNVLYRDPTASIEAPTPDFSSAHPCFRARWPTYPGPGDRRERLERAPRSELEEALMVRYLVLLPAVLVRYLAVPPGHWFDADGRVSRDANA